MFRRIVSGVVMWLLAAKSLTAGPGITFIENKGQWPQRFDFTAKVSGAIFGAGAGTFSYMFVDQRQIEARHYGNQPGSGENDFASHDPTLLRGHLVTTSFLGFNQDQQAPAFRANAPVLQLFSWY